MRKACILVIEEHEQERALVTGALEEAGYEVKSAKNANEGLRIMFESYPDVIILDCRLSEAPGKDARTRVRQASYLPIIVLGDQTDAVESLEIGADAFMASPFRPRELVARVRSLINRKLKSIENGNTKGGSHTIWN